jgi:hypothetical protein
MKAIVKKTNEVIEVHKKTESIDDMTFYYVYEDINTHKIYKYSELKFK